MQESKTIDHLLNDNQHDEVDTSPDVEINATTTLDSSLFLPLGLSEGSTISSKTRTWPNAQDIVRTNGEAFARIESGMTITLSKVFDPNRQIFKYWFIIDGAITTISWRSYPSELGTDRGPGDWKIRFKNGAGGTIEFYLVDTLRGRDEGRLHGFRHFCDWNQHSITPRIDLESCGWFDDFEIASRQYMGGWIQKCS